MSYIFALNKGFTSRMITNSSTNTKVFTLRLKPGDDVFSSLQEFVSLEKIHAGFIVSAVGSLTVANLRFANAKEGSRKEGFFEVVSLSGTVALSGHHLHMCISDQEGKCVGGHVMMGCVVYTTLELAILSLEDKTFARVHEPKYGYDELVVYDK